jgi:hypothetical protein
MRLRTLFAALLTVGVAGSLVGCGSRAADDRLTTVPVSGTVHFKGKPIPGALVTLHPKTPLEGNAPTPRATVGPDGKFEVTTYLSRDGAPQGDYTVTVHWYKPVVKQGELVAGPNVIPPRYQRPQTSDLSVSVRADTAQLNPIVLR